MSNTLPNNSISIDRELTRWDTIQIGLNNDNYSNYPVATCARGSVIGLAKIEIRKNNPFESSIHIGNFCEIANDVLFLLNLNHDYKSISICEYPFQMPDLPKFKIPRKGQVIIKNDVWIGDSVIILSGVTIGNGTVIGAGSVITKDVPDYAIVAGNPAKIIKYRFPQDQIDKLLKICWWDWDNKKLEKEKEWFFKDIEIFTNRYVQFLKEKNIFPIKCNKVGKTFLYIADIDQPFSLYERVIKQFCETFEPKDEVTLLLRIEQNDNFENNFQKLIEMNIDDAYNIVIINDPIDDWGQIFCISDYFITNRSKETIKFIGYCDKYNVKVLSGVDTPIFDFNDRKSL